MNNTIRFEGSHKIGDVLNEHVYNNYPWASVLLDSDDIDIGGMIKTATAEHTLDGTIVNRNTSMPALPSNGLLLHINGPDHGLYTAVFINSPTHKEYEVFTFKYFYTDGEIVQSAMGVTKELALEGLMWLGIVYLNYIARTPQQTYPGYTNKERATLLYRIFEKVNFTVRNAMETIGTPYISKDPVFPVFLEELLKD